MPSFRILYTVACLMPDACSTTTSRLRVSRSASRERSDTLVPGEPHPQPCAVVKSLIALIPLTVLDCFFLSSVCSRSIDPSILRAMTSRRAAPLREVLSILRTGSYGKVEWEAGLSCGHVARLKRKPPKEHVRCIDCLVDGEPAPRPPSDVPLDPVVMMMTEEVRVKEVLSQKLGVPSHSISVVFDPWTNEVSTVNLELPAPLVRELMKR